MTKTDPKEVRKIFTMGFPQPQNADLYAFNHGGQIIFSPGNSKDGYLYVFTGHGIIQTATGQVDFSWNEDSDLGKIIRLDTKPFTGKYNLVILAITEPCMHAYTCIDVSFHLYIGLPNLASYTYFYALLLFLTQLIFSYLSFI